MIPSLWDARPGGPAHGSSMIGDRSASLVLSRPIGAALEPFDAPRRRRLPRLSVVRPVTRRPEPHDPRLPRRQRDRATPPIRSPEPEPIAIIDTIHVEGG